MNIAICDDDKKALSYYSDWTKMIAAKVGMDVQIKLYRNGEQFLFALDGGEQPDIIFLDVIMPKADGMTVARHLSEEHYPGVVVIISTSEEYAFQAFDANAFNYVLKDGENDGDRFERVFLQAAAAVQERKRHFILINGITEHRNIPIDSIRYFEVMNHVCVVHYGNNESMEFLSSLGKLENLLVSQGFVRTQRSYLVNCAYITSYTYDKAQLSDGTVIPIGRQRQAEFKETMKARATVRVERNGNIA